MERLRLGNSSRVPPRKASTHLCTRLSFRDGLRAAYASARDYSAFLLRIRLATFRLQPWPSKSIVLAAVAHRRPPGQLAKGDLAASKGPREPRRWSARTSVISCTNVRAKLPRSLPPKIVHSRARTSPSSRRCDGRGGARLGRQPPAKARGSTMSLGVHTLARSACLRLGMLAVQEAY